MAKADRHIIRRQVLELRGVLEEDARPLQAEIGRLFQEQILPLLDRHLSAYSPNGVRHRIDKLELDLGVIRREHLTEDWVRKTALRLAEALKPAAASAASSEKQTARSGAPVSKTAAALELLRYFLTSGSLPWWADRTIPDPVTESIRLLLRDDPTLLRSWMQRWTAQPAALRRILTHGRFPLWATLATLPGGSKPGVFPELLAELADLLGRLPPWQGRSRRQIREMLGGKILPWVYSTPDLVIDTTAFWKGLLLQLISDRTMSYDQLLEGLHKHLAGTEKQETGLAVYVPALWAERAPAADTGLATTWLMRIKRLQGNPDFPQEIQARLQEIRGQLTGGHPDDENRQQAIGFVQYLEWWSSLLVGVQRLEGIRGLSAAATARLKVIRAQLNSRRPLEEKEWMRLSGLLEQLEKEQSGPTEADTFSEVEALYLDNAGLVILWPFLSRFFENLSLVKDRAFTDIAAAHRAAGLLQFLADGQREPQEYHCGLNKILCGLEWDAVLDFGAAVTDAELAAGEALLRAAIAHAPILNEMTIEGFRGTFLLRKGVLRAGAGMWQLQIERASYDVVLDRFPWSWKVVKLPWMGWGMEVGWLH